VHLSIPTSSIIRNEDHCLNPTSSVKLLYYSSSQDLCRSKCYRQCQQHELFVRALKFRSAALTASFLEVIGWRQHLVFILCGLDISTSVSKSLKRLSIIGEVSGFCDVFCPLSPSLLGEETKTYPWGQCYPYREILRNDIEMYERQTFTPLFVGILFWIDILEDEKATIFWIGMDVIFGEKVAGAIDWGSGESTCAFCIVNGLF